MKTQHQIFFDALRKQVKDDSAEPAGNRGTHGWYVSKNGTSGGSDSKKAASEEIMKELERKFNELFGNPEDESGSNE